jgi:hypothetical protein
MHDIIFKYQPYGKLLFKKKVKTSHPENWGELTRLQFEDVVEFISKPKKTDSDFTLLTNSLLSLKDPLTDFPLEIYELQKFLSEKPDFDCWIIKDLEINGDTLNSPDDRFRNITIAQFAFADTFCIQFLRDKKEETLDKMIVSLYHPGKSFNPDEIEERAIAISKLSPRTKAAILFNYQVIRNWIRDKYPYVFPKPTEKEEKQGSKSLKPHSNWRDFLRSLVNGDYVNEDKILNTLMHTILYDMNKNIEEQKKKKK